MRSLFSFGASEEMSLAIAGTGHRPEMLRRKTLANNSRIAIALGAATMPFAIYWLVTGTVFPFLLATIALGSGMTTLALHQRRMFEQAAAVQVHTMLVLGLLLTLADPRLGDAGLAIALMSPIMASLIGRAGLRRQSWMLLAGVLAVGALVASFSVPAIPLSPMVLMVCSALTFVASIGVVIHTANRINRAYEVYDKAQVNAYRHLIENVQDAVIRFSSDGEVLLASRSSERLFG